MSIQEYQCFEEASHHLIQQHKCSFGVLSQQNENAEQQVDSENEFEAPSLKRTRTMRDYLTPKQSLAEIVTCLAIDGASINFITNNSFIRESIAMYGYKLPTRRADVMSLVHADFEDKKESFDLS